MPTFLVEPLSAVDISNSAAEREDVTRLQARGNMDRKPR
jgi:hypothetical protein